MHTNIGKYDRLLRIVFGLILLLVGFGNLVSGFALWAVYFFAIIFLFTGIFAWCGFYSVLGISTKKRVKSNISKKNLEHAVKHNGFKSSDLESANLGASEVKKATKKTSKKKVVKKENLARVEGIGPVIQQHLYNENINTYADLAKAKVPKLKEILEKNALGFHDPSTWPEQAKLAKAKKWAQLKKLQDELIAGKRK